MVHPSLSLKEEKALQEFKASLVSKYCDKLVLIELFGSKARGDYNQYSDLDILVVTENKDPVLNRKISDLAFDIGLKFNLCLSLKILDKTFFGKLENLGAFFIESIKKEGIILWKKN
ncbi:MAG: nucleotidyltransferase domain-containing protein [Candidatus Omnitrophica bacterium]|nr:nucleotidyltransferase domain-containing protein [Candidatus Omnitrophota bacterium]